MAREFVCNACGYEEFFDSDDLEPCPECGVLMEPVIAECGEDANE